MFDKTQVVNGRSTRSLLVSLAIHGALAIALFAVHFTVKSQITRRSARVQLIAPAAPLNRKHVAVRAPARPPEFHPGAKLPALSLPAQPPAPRLQAPPVLAETAPKPQPIPPSQPAVPPNVFAAATPAAKTKPILPTPVQMGGFSSVSTAPAPSARTQIAAAGFGDAAVAATAGARRTVATGAGFSDAGVGSTAVAQRAPVRASGFGDAVSAAPSSGGARPDAAPTATAAQILEKPRPAYTEEARRLQIEGEVQLEVLFGASGEIHILRLVRGLGHGLDENAAQAARAIRYLPARRDGRPVDSTATVHIIFQLAS
jgi:TonB family protein